MKFSEIPVHGAEKKSKQKIDLRENKQIGFSQENKRLRVGKKELVSFQMI